jgi:hypothetical protein
MDRDKHLARYTHVRVKVHITVNRLSGDGSKNSYSAHFYIMFKTHYFIHVFTSALECHLNKHFDIPVFYTDERIFPMDLIMDLMRNVLIYNFYTITN